MENGEMEIREWKFEEMGFPSLPQACFPTIDVRFAKGDVEMAGVFRCLREEISPRGHGDDEEVEFAGMGFPSLPQVSCPARDIRFAKSDGGITGVLSGIGVESTFWIGR